MPFIDDAYLRAPGGAIDTLRELVSIPSVSVVPHAMREESHHEIGRVSKYLEKEFTLVGCDVEEIFVNGSAPYLIAKARHTNELAKEVLIYSHTDVHPVSDLDPKWREEAFKLVERNGRLYGRGSADDKGGIVAALTVARALHYQYGKDWASHLNVKPVFLFEGEEEIGSPSMKDFLKILVHKINPVALIVLDSTLLTPRMGTISCSNRGIIEFTLNVKAMDGGAKHSGQCLLVPNPNKQLARIIHLLTPEKIPRFDKGFVSLSDESRRLLRKNSQHEPVYIKNAHLISGASLIGNPNISIAERLVEEPCIQALNISGGSIGSSIPATAKATISIRTRNGQNPEEVRQIVKDYVGMIANPHHMQITMEDGDAGAFAFMANLEGPYMRLYMEMLKDYFPEGFSLQASGGTLPLLHEFYDAFPNIEIITTGVADKLSNAHGDYESQSIEALKYQINALINFLKQAE